MESVLRSMKRYSSELNSEALLKSFTELDIIFNSIPAFIYFKDKDDHFLKVNKAFADSAGLPADRMIGKTTRELFPEYSDQYVQDDQEVISSGTPKLDIIEPLSTTDGVRWVHTNKIPYVDADGSIVGVIGLSLNITDLVKSKEDLRISQTQYMALMGNIPDIVYTLDHKGRFIDWNHDSLASRLLGYAKEEIIGKRLVDLIAVDDQPAIKAEIHSSIKNKRQYSRENQFRVMTKDGYALWFEGHSHYTYDDKGNFIREYGVLRDITGKKLIETELTIFATTDILTDVFNRRVGITMLKQQLHQSLRNKKKMVICFIDVNGLKKINDTYGHKEGDRLIVSVADVLKKCARNSDIIARMGGDEFLYVLTDCDTKGADKAWDRVTAEFDLINSSGKNKYTISASKGFAELDPKEPKSADELIALADANMYEDKRLYKEKNH